MNMNGEQISYELRCKSKFMAEHGFIKTWFYQQRQRSMQAVWMVVIKSQKSQQEMGGPDYITSI